MRIRVILTEGIKHGISAEKTTKFITQLINKGYIIYEIFKTNIGFNKDSIEVVIQEKPQEPNNNPKFSISLMQEFKDVKDIHDNVIPLAIELLDELIDKSVRGSYSFSILVLGSTLKEPILRTGHYENYSVMVSDPNWYYVNIFNHK